MRRCYLCDSLHGNHGGNSITLRLGGSVVGFRGPWGTSYPSNLRLMVQDYDEYIFVQTAHTRGSLPPMPWPNVNRMSEQDVRSIYRFIASLGPTGTRMPLAVAPGKPTTPYIDFVPQHIERLTAAAPASDTTPTGPQSHREQASPIDAARTLHVISQPRDATCYASVAPCMPHRHWQPDALSGRRTRLLTTNESGLWAAVDDDASHLLYHSADGGRNWRLASRGLPAAARITALLTDPTGLLLATRRRGFFRSRDSGTGWQSTGSDQLLDTEVSALVSRNGLLFAGTRTSGVWRSADDGCSWRSASVGLPLAGRGLSILSLAPTPVGVVASHSLGIHRWQMPGWAFAGSGLPPGVAHPWIDSSGDVLVTGGATGIYCSTDRGSSWTHVFPSAASQLVITSLTTSRNIIFAGTMHPRRGSGLHVSSDGGTSWSVLCDGLDDDLTPFHLASFPGGVAVGTREHGVWIRALDDAPTVRKRSLTETRLPLVLRQNTPNPFSTTTTIAYVVLRAETVRLDVRDVAGRGVARLVDKRQDAGAYEVVFDAGELGSGFYTYHLSLGGLSQSRQMLLLR